MHSIVKNIIPNWVTLEEILGEGEVTVDSITYQYHVLCKEKELNLPGFVGFAKTEFLFISEEVPENYRQHILRHEVREFVRLKGKANACLESLTIELTKVPKDIYADYVAYRLEFFEKFVRYAKDNDYDKTFRAGIEKSLRYLKSLP